MYNWQTEFTENAFQYFKHKRDNSPKIFDDDIDKNIMAGHKCALLYAKLINSIQKPKVLELFESQVNFLLKQKPFVIRLMHRPNYEKYSLRIREIYKLDDDDFQRPVIYQRSLRQLGKTVAVAVQNYALLVSAPTDDMFELVFLLVAGTKEELSIETLREIRDLLEGSSWANEYFDIDANTETIVLSEKMKRSGKRYLRKGVNNKVSVINTHTHTCICAA